MKVAFFTEDLNLNSIGRTYCLWLLAEAAGYESQTFSTQGSEIWPPLSETEFAKTVLLASEDEMFENQFIKDADILIAIKPLPASFGVAARLAEQVGKPLILDIDDPDLESRLSFEQPIHAIGREIARARRQRSLRKLRRMTARYPTITSNPVLFDTYGGVVIGHAREVPEACPQSHGWGPSVCFVGSNRSHKGVPVLREAIASLAPMGFQLTITDSAPTDSKPWENWVGQTSFEKGLELVRSSDISCVPSLDTVYSRGQFPAKLVDAMLAGRCVVASDLPPIRWALGKTGILVPPGDAPSLSRALLSLRDPARRRDLGTDARKEAIGRFSVGALVPLFVEAVERAILRV